MTEYNPVINYSTLIPLGLIVLAIAFFIRRSLHEQSNANTLLRFFQFGKGFKERSFFATLIASNSGLSSAVFLIVIYGYYYGVGILPWIVAFWLLTQITSTFTIKHVQKTTKNLSGFIENNGTLHEYLGLIYSSSTLRRVTGMVSTIAYLGLVSIELLLGYEILRAIIPNSTTFFGFELVPLVFVLLLAMIIIFYTSRSGFRAVVSTDKIQIVLIMTMLIGFSAFIIFHVESISANYSAYFVPLSDVANSIFNPTGEGVLSFLFFFVVMNILFWGLWWPSAMDQWHRVASTRSARRALDKKFGTLGVGSIVYFSLFSLILLSIGVLIRTTIEPTSGAVQPLYYFISSMIPEVGSAFFILKCVGLGVAILGLVAIFISTVDTYVVVASQSFVSDVLFTKRYGKTLHELDSSINKSMQKKLLSTCRRTIMLFSIPIVCLFFAITRIADIFTMIYLLFCMLTPLLAVLLISFYCNRNTLSAKAGVWSVICGSIWGLVTNIILVFTIHQMILSNLMDQVMIFYNLLYANPATTMVLTMIVYAMVRKLDSERP